MRRNLVKSLSRVWWGGPTAVREHPFLCRISDRCAVLAERRMDPVGLDRVECIVCNGFLAVLAGRIAADGFRWFYVVEDRTQEITCF